MRYTQICATTCCALALVACVTDYGFGKLPIAQPRALAVSTFPTNLGDWQGGGLLPVDPDVQAKLPSAKIIDRNYTNSIGETVDLTLVTANDSLDIHDPVVCLPAQGWQIVDSSQAVYGGQLVNILDLTQDGQSMRAVYWWTGYYPPKLSSHFWVQDAAKFRAKMINKREGESLMVRILSTDNDPNELEDFTKAVLPEVKKLTDDGAMKSVARQY